MYSVIITSNKAFKLCTPVSLGLVRKEGEIFFNTICLYKDNFLKLYLKEGFVFDFVLFITLEYSLCCKSLDKKLTKEAQKSFFTRLPLIFPKALHLHIIHTLRIKGISQKG